MKKYDYEDVPAILLCRYDDFSQAAHQILSKHWPCAVEILCQETGKKPEGFVNRITDKVVFSFRSLIILNLEELNSAKLALNFHPGPPEYPGVGGYNFALYENANEYGATAHIMAPKVDSGQILRVTRFQIKHEETVWSLKEETNMYLLRLFEEVLVQLLSKRGLSSFLDRPDCQKLTWGGPPRSRKELNELCTVNLEMAPDEIKRRIRACHYPPDHGLGFVVDNKAYKLI